MQKKICPSRETYERNVQLRNDAQTLCAKRKNSTSHQQLQVSPLIESKAELLAFTRMDLEKKHDIEINILHTQLEKEKLQMQLIKKEIAIKDCILQQLRNTDTEITEYL